MFAKQPFSSHTRKHLYYRLEGDGSMTGKENRMGINPASGSIMMAFGIFLYGAIKAFPTLHHVFGHVLVAALILSGIVIFHSLSKQYLNKDRSASLSRNPVNSFVMGTLIAGISVWCNVVLQYYPALKPVIGVIAGWNTIFYFIFFTRCVKNLYAIWHNLGSHSPNGVLLLSTVATQSVIILWMELVPSLPLTLIVLAMAQGLALYFISLFLIGYRYIKRKDWSLARDWTNTNCIIHGALSITGLAMVLTQAVHVYAVVSYWIAVLLILAVIECIEIIRAVLRVRQMGWKKGIFTYHISQWSRNFTFGMFYAFTMVIHESALYRHAIFTFHEAVLHVWAWIVLLLLLFEACLWMEARFRVSMKIFKKEAM